MAFGYRFGYQKYKAKKAEIDGIQFDSQKEANYYVHFKRLEDEGQISNLRLQVPYELLPAIWEDTVVKLKTKEKTIHKCLQRAVTYVADFVFEDKDGNTSVVDVKGFKTKEYLLKKKMMLALKGIKITEV